MTKRLIIIDSPPQGGSTQLRHALEEHLHGSFTVAQTDYTEGVDGYRFFNAIKPALLGRANVILEGSWYRVANKMEPAELQMLERAALSCGVVHIVCRPSRYLGLREGLDVMDVLLGDNHTRIEFDYNSNLHADISSFIQRNVLPTMDETRMAPEPYVGKWDKRAIALVSDKPSFKGFAPPFISFRKDGVSWWLADGLARAKIPESSLIWVNCRDADEVEVDPGPLLALKPYQIVALGEQAVKWCNEYEMDFVIEKHPLYWKKNHPKQAYPLMKTLAGLVGEMR
jgi:hypothetical protein